VRLSRAGVGADAFAALDRGERDAALDALIAEIADHPANGDAGATRDLLRQAVIGILAEDPADPDARSYRRKLASALG
jgi:thioredoxin-like negative regulator of GroEL